LLKKPKLTAGCKAKEEEEEEEERRRRRRHSLHMFLIGIYI
jgi:hypothetical protein